MRELWYASGKDKMSIHALKHSDFVTTTGEKLKKTFGYLNDEVYITRNMFDWELPQWQLDIDKTRKEMLEEWYPTDDKIIIGWAGLTSHYQDISRMHTIFKRIHDKHPETHFVLAGMALKDSAVEISYDENNEPVFKEKEVEDDNLRYKNRVKNLYSDLDPKRLKIFDALPLEMYGKFYTLFDISLAYIEHNAFNSCKSEIKVVESLHYGMPTIFSNYGGYKDFWNSFADRKQHEHLAINSMVPKRWVEDVEYWVNKIKEDRAKGTTFVKDKMAKVKKFSDDTYDLNLNVEDRLFFYLEKAEAHEENEINRIASEVNKFNLR